MSYFNITLKSNTYYSNLTPLNIDTGYIHIRGCGYEGISISISIDNYPFIHRSYTRRKPGFRKTYKGLGGGLTCGDKILGHGPLTLIHHNVGAFFAQRGFVTITRTIAA